MKFSCLFSVLLFATLVSVIDCTVYSLIRFRISFRSTSTWSRFLTSHAINFNETLGACDVLRNVIKKTHPLYYDALVGCSQRPNKANVDEKTQIILHFNKYRFSSQIEQQECLNMISNEIRTIIEHTYTNITLDHVVVVKPETPHLRLAKYLMDCNVYNDDSSESENKPHITELVIKSLYQHWFPSILPLSPVFLELRKLRSLYAEVEVYLQEEDSEYFQETKGDLTSWVKEHSVRSVLDKVESIDDFHPEPTPKMITDTLVVVTHTCTKWKQQNLLVLSFDGQLLINHIPIEEETHGEHWDLHTVIKYIGQPTSDEWHLPLEFVRMSVLARYTLEGKVFAVADMYFNHPAHMATPFRQLVMQSFQSSGNGFTPSTKVESNTKRCLVFKEPIEIVELHVEGKVTLNGTIIHTSNVPSENTKVYDIAKQTILDSIMKSMNNSNYTPDCILNIGVHKLVRKLQGVFAYATIVFDAVNISRMIAVNHFFKEFHINYLDIEHPDDAPYDFKITETRIVNTTTVCEGDYNSPIFSGSVRGDSDANQTIKTKVIDIQSHSPTIKGSIILATSAILLMYNLMRIV